MLSVYLNSDSDSEDAVIHSHAVCGIESVALVLREVREIFKFSLVTPK